MAINSTPINSTSVNGSSINAVLSGELVLLEQGVVRQVSGELVAIEQNVTFAAQVSGELVAIEQTVEAFLSGELVQLEQHVLDYSIGRIARLGWDLSVFIDGAEVDPELISGDLKVRRSESTASLCDFTLLAEAGLQDYESLHGKEIVVNCHTDTGVYRVYTGIVDIPDINLSIERALIRCTDRREEQLNNQPDTVINSIGYYSPLIFDEPESKAEEVEQRLTTTPHSVDFDPYGQYTITPWLPKATADFVFVDEDIFAFQPKIQLASRARIVNNVEIKFGHSFDRFYQAGAGYSWTHAAKDRIGLYLVDGYSLTTREMVRQAAQSAGWYIPGNNITFDPIWPNGWYYVDGTLVGFSTTQTRGESVPVLDESGNQVSDADGNPSYETRITGGTDMSQVFCLGAYWTAYKRWAQTVTEEYSMTVKSPQSIDQYGTITKTLNYAFQEESEASEWEGATAFPVGQGFNGIHDQDKERTKLDDALNVALRQAKNTIEGSHRATTVTFDTVRIRPELDLVHTLEVAAEELDCKGKIQSIEHRFNIRTGEAKTTVTVVLSRAQGSQAESALQSPGKIADNINLTLDTRGLGNWFGITPSYQMTGMIGNRWIQANNNIWRTNYPEQFRVDTPSIPTTFRGTRSLTNDSLYNVELRNDPLTITFDGDYLA